MLINLAVNCNELIQLKDTVENLIAYESNQQINTSKQINKYIRLGSILLVVALLHNQFSYLDYIFTPNAADFVQGAMYGISIAFNVIGIYNNSHNITIQERKKRLFKR